MSKAGKHKRVVSFDYIKFKKLREDAGLTKYQLAFETGTDNATLVRLEKGEIDCPNIEFIYRMSKYFEVPIEDLLKINEPVFNEVIGAMCNS